MPESIEVTIGTRLSQSKTKAHYEPVSVTLTSIDDYKGDVSMTYTCTSGQTPSINPPSQTVHLEENEVVTLSVTAENLATQWTFQAKGKDKTDATITDSDTTTIPTA